MQLEGVLENRPRDVHAAQALDAQEASHQGLRWIYPRYWFSLGADNYVFGTPELFLAPMTWQHIVRHTPLKTDMNPYLDREYFERRAATLRRCGSGSFHRPASRQ